MKYCPKCGTRNEENSKFCVKCGNAFETASQQGAPNTETGTKKNRFKMDTEEAQNTDSVGIGKVIGLVIVSIFILIGLGLGGHSFYLNHRSTQSTANMAQTIADNDFGDDEVQVYYSKKSNLFTIKTLSDSGVRANLKEYMDSYDDNQDDMNDLTSNYKDFIRDVNDHMGSKYKRYYTELENPWNHSRVYIYSTGTKITYNYLDD